MRPYVMELPSANIMNYYSNMDMGLPSKYKPYQNHSIYRTLVHSILYYIFSLYQTFSLSLDIYIRLYVCLFYSFYSTVFDECDGFVYICASDSYTHWVSVWVVVKIFIVIIFCDSEKVWGKERFIDTILCNMFKYLLLTSILWLFRQLVPCFVVRATAAATAAYAAVVVVMFFALGVHRFSRRLDISSLVFLCFEKLVRFTFVTLCERNVCLMQ